MPVQPAPRAALKVIESQLLLPLLVSLLAHPSRLDEKGELLRGCIGWEVGQVVPTLP
jgi:hypothetical protein